MQTNTIDKLKDVLAEQLGIGINEITAESRWMWSPHHEDEHDLGCDSLDAVLDEPRFEVQRAAYWNTLIHYTLNNVPFPRNTTEVAAVASAPARQRALAFYATVCAKGE